jgi:hypothetical protein
MTIRPKPTSPAPPHDTATTDAARLIHLSTRALARLKGCSE